VIDVPRVDCPCSRGCRLARLGVAVLAGAMLSAAGFSGALAQQEDGIYGDIGVSPVTEEVVPTPGESEALVGEDIEVPEAMPSILGEEIDVPEVTPSILEEDTQVPEEINATLGEDFPVPVDLTAIFGEGFPFGEEGAPDDAIGGDITVGGTDAGTITLGDGGEGDISIGGGELPSS
jgi:hypothetical protein